MKNHYLGRRGADDVFKNLDFKDFSLILKKKIKRNQIAALQRWLFDI